MNILSLLYKYNHLIIFSNEYINFDKINDNKIKTIQNIINKRFK